MGEERPPAEQLPLVGDGEHVLRLVHPAHYVDGRLENACLPSRDWKGKPDPRDYGPSVYVASIRNVAGLEAANPAWQKFGVVRVEVAELQQLGLTVRFTQMDCDARFEDLRPAHATLFGVTAENRDDVVALLARHLERPPVK